MSKSEYRRLDIQNALPKQCSSCGGMGCGNPCEYDNKKLGSDRNSVLDEAIKAANGVDALFYNRAKVGEAIEALKEKDDD